MTPKRYERLREVFLSIYDLPVNKREAAIERQCADDPSMKDEIMTLLTMDAKVKGLLESPTLTDELERKIAEVLLSQTTERLPETIGPYRILKKLGDGGMGAVFEAQQDHPRRTVALKMIRSGFASDQMLKRFEHEAHVLGLLQHPGIAQIFEAGTADTGSGPQPYFAMELVLGEPLSSYAKQHALGTRQCLELVSKLCDAIQHAHTKGVVHRDLKPGNVLVTKDGQPKILDFGIARATDSDIRMTTLQTDIGQLIGTIPYMSPEQAGGNTDEIDTRTDVYSLGVLLYELLANRLPYELKEKMIHEAVRVIREEEPTHLSSINPHLRGDIETIVTKALEKSRDRRYQTAGELAADIRRYLNDEPIVARPASAMYQFRKFAKRNKALVGGLAATFVVLILGIAGTSWGMARAIAAENDEKHQRIVAEKHARRAVTERRKYEQVAQIMQEMISGIDPALAHEHDTYLLSQLLQAATARIEREHVDDPEIELTLRSTIGITYLRIGQLDKARIHLLRAREIAHAQFGENHVETVRSMLDLGSLEIELGQYAQAETTMMRAYEVAKQLLGEEDELALECMNGLAVIHRKLGQYKEAEHLYLRILEQVRANHQEESATTLTVTGNLAALYRDLGRYAEAEELNREVLGKQRQLLGDLDPRTMRTRNNLALLLGRQGRHAEAESMFRDLLQDRQEVEGEDHPNALTTMGNLASLLRSRGQYDESEELFLRTRLLQERVLGVDHPLTMGTINNLGLLYKETGQLQRACEAFEHLIPLVSESFGPDHRSTLTVRSNLGLVYAKQNRVDEAIEIFRAVLAARSRVLGNEHPDTLTSKSILGFQYGQQGLYLDAKLLLEEALAGKRSVLGEEHPSTLTTMKNLALVLQQSGSIDEAEDLYSTAIASARRVLGNTHPDTINLMSKLASLHQDQKRFAEAEVLLELAYRNLEELRGLQHGRTIERIRALSSLYEAWDKPERAAEYRALLEDAETEPQDNSRDDSGAERPDESDNPDGGADEDTTGDGSADETRGSTSPPKTSSPEFAIV